MLFGEIHVSNILEWKAGTKELKQSRINRFLT